MLIYVEEEDLAMDLVDVEDMEELLVKEELLDKEDMKDTLEIWLKGKIKEINREIIIRNV